MGQRGAPAGGTARLDERMPLSRLFLGIAHGDLTREMVDGAVGWQAPRARIGAGSGGQW